MYDGIDAPFFEVPFAAAEMVKLVDNGFHAVKVTFANEVGRIGLSLGLDPQAVADLFLADTKLNISPAYLRPGGPYGGSCLPKDLGSMIALARERGLAVPMLEGTRRSNEAHLAFLVAEIRKLAPPPGPILQLGLSFKGGTDDLRNSPMVALADRLTLDGYELMIFDPDLEPSRLLGVNFALAAEHQRIAMDCLVRELEPAMERAALIVLGKAIPGIRNRLPKSARVVDIDRLRSRLALG